MALRSITSGLRRLFHKETVERDLDDEVGHYLEMATREQMRRGLTRAEAERAARVALGGVEATKEHVRSGGWDARVETLWRDARYAVRGLRRNPAFAIVAILTLALGIGATTAMFSVVNAVMLRPLPYHDARRLSLIWTDDTRRGLHTELTAYLTITDWRSLNHTLDEVAFYNIGRATMNDTAGRERTLSALVSGNLFKVLEVPAARGRAISADDEADAAQVAVISHSLWQRHFGGADDVVGRSFTIENAGKGSGQFRIVGVMPPGFYFPNKQTEVWMPATTYWRFVRESQERFQPWARRWIALARLKPGAAVADAQADLAGIGRRLASAYQTNVPDFPGFTTSVAPLLDNVAGKNLQTALWLLLGAVGLVLLVACANVANLLLARGAGRQHEFALRRALGAGRARLVRQLIVESLALASIGGACGLAVAWFGTRLVAARAAAEIPRIDEVGVDANVLMFATIASIAAGVIFGVIPALRVSGRDAIEALRENGRVSGGRRLLRTRGLLVVAECAMAVVLLAGAGLLLRSLDRLDSIDPGFDPAGVLSMRLEFPPGRPMPASESTNESQAAHARARAEELRGLAARIAALPGVHTVGFIDDLFVAGQGNSSITIPGRSVADTGQLNDGSVDPGFLRTMGVPLRRGRFLTPDDASTKTRALWPAVIPTGTLADKARASVSEPVVVNDAFVQRFFPTGEPLGQRFCIDPTNKTYWYEIVGVVGDMRRQGLDHEAIPEYFGPLIPSANSRADLLVRADGDPLALAPGIRQLITSTLPGTLIPIVSTADRELAAFSAPRRFQTWLLTAFAALALALAAIGIYGVIHYTVAERAREIGVRIALGAARTDVLRTVLVQGMRLPLAGVALGVLGALALTRTMTRLLFGTSPTDPLTYAVVALTLLVVALFACLAPAHRASRVDPLVTLRHE